MSRERSLVAPSLADEEYARAGRGREHVVGDASVLLERGGGQFLGGGESVIETAVLGLKEAVESEHGRFPFLS